MHEHIKGELRYEAWQKQKVNGCCHWLTFGFCFCLAPLVVAINLHFILTINLHLVSKVVTYWLAKLLDPQHNVVISDEHQDFQVSPHMISNLTSDNR